MEVGQRYVIKFFTDEGIPAVRIISRLRDHHGEVRSLEGKFIFGPTKYSAGVLISAILQAPEENGMKVLLGLLLRTSMQALLSQRESSPSLCGLRFQRSVGI
jgi:hypothetical protein